MEIMEIMESGILWYGMYHIDPLTNSGKKDLANDLVASCVGDLSYYATVDIIAN